MAYPEPRETWKLDESSLNAQEGRKILQVQSECVRLSRAVTREPRCPTARDSIHGSVHVICSISHICLKYDHHSQDTICLIAPIGEVLLEP